MFVSAGHRWAHLENLPAYLFPVASKVMLGQEARQLGSVAVVVTARVVCLTMDVTMDLTMGLMILMMVDLVMDLTMDCSCMCCRCDLTSGTALSLTQVVWKPRAQPLHSNIGAFPRLSLWHFSHTSTSSSSSNPPAALKASRSVTTYTSSPTCQTAFWIQIIGRFHMYRQRTLPEVEKALKLKNRLWQGDCTKLTLYSSPLYSTQFTHLPLGSCLGLAWLLEIFATGCFDGMLGL